MERSSASGRQSDSCEHVGRIRCDTGFKSFGGQLLDRTTMYDPNDLVLWISDGRWGYDTFHSINAPDLERKAW